MKYPILNSAVYEESLAQQIIDAAEFHNVQDIEIPFEEYCDLCKEEGIKGVLEINGIKVHVIK